MVQVPLHMQTDLNCTIGSGVVEGNTEDERDETRTTRRRRRGVGDHRPEQEGREQMMRRGARRNPGIQMVVHVCG